MFDSQLDRRAALKALGLGALAPAVAGALASCAEGAGAGGGGGTGGQRTVKLGFIALTDCASLVMAKELGFFAKRDLDVQIIKQASWASTRDNLLTGQIDGAHCLFSMPLSVATGIGGTGSRDLKIAMTLSNNGQAITLAEGFKGVAYGDLAAAKAALAAKPPVLAMTFPGGTHDTWLRYWLKATKADLGPVKIVTIPPAQMVANMKVGAMQGYCVGEPWNAVAVKDGIGFTYLTTQDIWQHHPEKALVVNAKFAAEKKDVLKDVMAAVLEASTWLDDLANRPKASETIGADAYIKAEPKAIEGRLLGKYDLGGGLGEKTYAEDYMRFSRDGVTNAPRRAHALWFLAQYQRFGLLKEAPAYKQIVDDLILTDLYAEVAAAAKVPVPDDDMKPFEVKLDGATFDPAKPDEEAKRP